MPHRYMRVCAWLCCGILGQIAPTTATYAAQGDPPHSTSSAIAMAFSRQMGPQKSRINVASTATNASMNEKANAPILEPVQLKEVIVTAEKRAEPLQNVPAPISTISGDTLATFNVTSLSDMSGYVPGLTLNSYGAPGANTLEIHGLGDGYLSDFAGPLVATYIDDEQIGSSTSAGRGNLFGLDLVPYDIERVEVLEGPQGTLWGANAMGGIIRYILKKPNLSELSAEVGGDAAHVTGSGGADSEERAMVNLPLVRNALGLRLSGFYRDNAGWINNLGIRKKDSNHSTEDGGRATLLWQATPGFSLQATVLAQDIHADDLSNVTINGHTLMPLYGSQVTSTYFPQLLVEATRNYSLHLNWDLGFATLTSVAGWSTLNTHLQEDFSNFAPPITGVANSIANFAIYTSVQKFVEETRLTSTTDGRLKWLAGGYFTHEDSGEIDNWPTYTADYAPLPESDNLYILDSGYSYAEAAVFGNVTYRIDKAFDIGAGGRYSRYHEYGCAYSTGLLGGGPPLCLNVPGSGASNVEATATNVWNWMGDLRWHINGKSMVYARVATGYRPGEPAGAAPEAVYLYGAPAVTNPDRTLEYDLGFKGLLLDNRLELDTSIFYIDWKNMQLENSFIKNNEPIVFLGNVGASVSNGADLTVVYLVTRGLRVNASVAYTNAHLTAAAPLSGGAVGDQLPLSARWVTSLGTAYTKQVGENTSLIIGAAYRYRDRVIDLFPGAGAGGNGPPADVTAPIRPWNIVDAYAGFVFSRLTVRLYGKNIFADQSYTGLQYINDPLAPRYVPILPRTIGLSADYEF